MAGLSDKCSFFFPTNARILQTWKCLSTFMLTCGAEQERDLLRGEGLIWNLIFDKCFHKHAQQPFTLALPSLCLNHSPELQAFGFYFGGVFISAHVCASPSAVFICCNNWLCQILSPDLHPRKHPSIEIKWAENSATIKHPTSHVKTILFVESIEAFLENIVQWLFGILLKTWVC